jgi:hypothetical protein
MDSIADREASQTKHHDLSIDAMEAVYGSATEALYGPVRSCTSLEVLSQASELTARQVSQDSYPPSISRQPGDVHHTISDPFSKWQMDETKFACVPADAYGDTFYAAMSTEPNFMAMQSALANHLHSLEEQLHASQSEAAHYRAAAHYHAAEVQADAQAEEAAKVKAEEEVKAKSDAESKAKAEAGARTISKAEAEKKVAEDARVKAEEKAKAKHEENQALKEEVKQLRQQAAAVCLHVHGVRVALKQKSEKAQTEADEASRAQAYHEAKANVGRTSVHHHNLKTVHVLREQLDGATAKLATVSDDECEDLQDEVDMLEHSLSELRAEMIAEDWDSDEEH